MTEFVLHQNVEAAGQQTTATSGQQAVTDPPQIRAAGKADHLHLMAQLNQTPGHHPVIQIATGFGVQAAIDDQTDAH